MKCPSCGSGVRATPADLQRLLVSDAVRAAVERETARLMAERIERRLRTVTIGSSPLDSDDCADAGPLTGWALAAVDRYGNWTMLPTLWPTRERAEEHAAGKGRRRRYRCVRMVRIGSQEVAP